MATHITFITANLGNAMFHLIKTYKKNEMLYTLLNKYAEEGPVVASLQESTTWQTNGIKRRDLKNQYQIAGEGRLNQYPLFNLATLGYGNEACSIVTNQTIKGAFTFDISKVSENKDAQAYSYAWPRVGTTAAIYGEELGTFGVIGYHCAPSSQLKLQKLQYKNLLKKIEELGPNCIIAGQYNSKACEKNYRYLSRKIESLGFKIAPVEGRTYRKDIDQYPVSGIMIPKIMTISDAYIEELDGMKHNAVVVKIKR